MGEWYQSVRSGLVLSGSTLYGTTEIFGTSSNGTVFAISTDGSGFTNLYNFDSLLGNINFDGANPSGAPLLSGNVLYGTANNGGSSGYGTVFSLSLTLPMEPQLTITAFGINVVLAWPTNVPGFNLQATTVIGSQTVWTNVLPEPVIVGGQNVVTNSISGSQVFYRLSQ